jgi:hypothetical protein
MSDAIAQRHRHADLDPVADIAQIVNVEGRNPAGEIADFGVEIGARRRLALGVGQRIAAGGGERRTVDGVLQLHAQGLGAGKIDGEPNEADEHGPHERPHHRDIARAGIPESAVW